MLIQLPLEVWMAILGWLRAYRRELAAKVNQLGDRTFSQICQFWLHDYAKNVQLGEMWIKSENVFNKDGQLAKSGVLKMCGFYDGRYRAPFAQVPMPENITGFKHLNISCLDSGVLNFLRQMAVFWANNGSKISISVEIDGEVDDDDLATMRTVIRHLMPLWNRGIEAIEFCPSSSILFSSTMRRFPSQIDAAKFLELSVNKKRLVKPIIRWLCTERADAEPRMAILRTKFTDMLIDGIHEQFLGAKSPISFFVLFWSMDDDDDFPGSSAVNVGTGEQLIIRRCDGVLGRCPAKADGDGWLRLMEKKAIRKKCSKFIRNMRIRLDRTLLGSMESGEEKKGDGNDENDDKGQPRPSKRRRLT